MSDLDPCACADTVCKPENYGRIRERITGCKFNLFNSGIATVDSTAQQFAMAPAWSANEIFYGDTIGNDEEGMIPGGEDLGCVDCETPCQKELTVRKIQRNKCFTEADCEVLCNRAPESPEDMIIEGINTQQTTFRESVIVNTLLGVYGNNIADNGSDMIHDATEGGTIAPDVGGWFDYCAFVDGCGVTCCDGPPKDVLIVHCDVFKDMLKCEQISFIQPSAFFSNSSLAGPGIPVYNGHVVIQHNRPEWVNMTGENPVYTSICAKRGFIRLGNGRHKNPLMADRNECYNNGDGLTSWTMREIFVAHPEGYSNCWTPPARAEGQKARFTQTNAELADPANWTRCWDRTNIGISFINTYAGKIVGKSAAVAG